MNNNMPKATFGMWPNDEEYEDDGQPSEMDEWLDFDPDC